ncbi:hypothetical protein [Leptospira kanakyensis]|uniref:hypothetical protein n=1 Tax=Leptospira kanakyensis TaxID=2484968 RepID=UPI00223D3C28|nr:hypothetical protein [Leptospira kanakyensis]MCW7471854.1 hypothetical protein [Leptospira kanakyensis]MCW7482574.1 hypothetical protein [Leptospira kanakyensis]
MKTTDIENKIKELEKIYTSRPDHYFFTEKEIHSEFYSLFQKESSNVKNHSLFHTEYPTPFKCSITNYKFKIEEADSKYKRSHIDSVIINPKFIEWIEKNNENLDYINGTPQKNTFKEYSDRLIPLYNKFYTETKESILQYAIEFKYYRHSYLGDKQPLKDVSQDISKMDALKNFGKRELKNEDAFVLKTKCIVILGGNVNEKLFNTLQNEFKNKVQFIKK